MRSLVTGGAGFIGSHLVDSLVESGDQVTVVDDLSRGTEENLESALRAGARLVRADIRDPEAVRDAFAAARPERVFHLAAQVSVRRSLADPALDADLNVRGTATVLEAARRAEVGRFVNASTGGPIYGEGAPRPTPESHPPAPKTPYGQSKLAAEGYCEVYRRSHGLSAVSLRYSNVYGPRQDPHGEAGVVAIFCGSLLAGRPVSVFGDGGQSRDFIYVEDVVAANLAAADDAVGGAINVSTGIGTSIRELLRSLSEIAGVVPRVDEAAARSGELRATALDPGAAAERLRWRANVRLGEGLERTMDSIAATTTAR